MSIFINGLAIIFIAFIIVVNVCDVYTDRGFIVFLDHQKVLLFLCMYVLYEEGQLLSFIDQRNCLNFLLL